MSRVAFALPLACLLGLAACAHDAPFGFSVPPAREAHTGGAFRQLTYNVGDDVDPAWLGDSTILFTAERLDRRDRDRCVVAVPITGGTIRPFLCPTTLPSFDSLDVVSSVAPGPGGALAYVWTRFNLFPLTAFRTRFLGVASLDDPQSARARIFMPVRAAGGIADHFGVSDIRWITPDEFVYRATIPHYPQPCKGCRRDAETPVELVRAHIIGDSLDLTAIPGTTFATSLALLPPDTLLYSVMGSGIVYRRNPGVDTSEVYADFSPDIVRGVQVAGNRVAAVVGGNVAVVVIPTIGITQQDDGGPVLVFTRTSIVADTVAHGLLYFRRLALSSDGHHLLAESGTGGTWDVWIVDLP